MWQRLKSGAPRCPLPSHLGPFLTRAPDGSRSIRCTRGRQALSPALLSQLSLNLPSNPPGPPCSGVSVSSSADAAQGSGQGRQPAHLHFFPASVCPFLPLASARGLIQNSTSLTPSFLFLVRLKTLPRCRDLNSDRAPERRKLFSPDTSGEPLLRSFYLVRLK